MNLLQDIFKILLQPVQLLIAALMFTYKEPKRKFWLIRAVLAAILGFLVLKLCITASPEILLNSFLASLVWSIGSFLILLSIDLFASICYNNIKMSPKGYRFYG